MRQSIIPVGPELDAGIAKRIFGQSPRKIAALKLLRLLLRYSWSWSAAGRIIGHFYGLGPDHAAVRRYNYWFTHYMKAWNSKRGFVGTMVTGTCPSNVCEATLYAVRDVVSD